MPQVLLKKKKKNGKRSLRFIYENAHMKYRILYISLLKSGSTLSTWELTYSLYHIQKISADIFLHEGLKFMYITYEKLSPHEIWDSVYFRYENMCSDITI